MKMHAIRTASWQGQHGRSTYCGLYIEMDELEARAVEHTPDTEKLVTCKNCLRVMMPGDDATF